MKKILSIMFLLLLATTIVSAAEENDDWKLFGLEGEKLFNLGSGILATILFGLTFLAYKRTKQKRLLYVTLAFFLFAIKALLGAHELFIEEIPWTEPTAAVLQFGILLSFFYGITKK